MQTIKFKTPNSDKVYSVDIDDDLYDTWEEVEIEGEDHRVNVWYDDPDEGILLSIYPYISVDDDGNWECDYDAFTRCTIINIDELEVESKKEVNKEREEETFTVSTSTEDGDCCVYIIKSKLDLCDSQYWGKEILEWLNKNGVYGTECEYSEFVTMVENAKIISGTI